MPWIFRMMKNTRWLPIVLLTALAGCDDTPAPASTPASAPSATVSAALTTSPSAVTSATATTSSDALDLDEFRRLFLEVSEADRYFFSDNYISNETSFLQPLELLRGEVAQGGAYLGVGPEQNFTYIALTQPKLAFIVDIRRDNALLHLFYKVLFQRSKTRAELLAQLVGRPYDAAGDPGPKGDLAAVLAHVEAQPQSRAELDRVHGAIEKTLRAWKLELSDKDFESIRKAHEAFYEGQLDLRFKLHENNGRTYPSLRELLLQKSPSGEAASFMASSESFAFVKTMHDEHRIIPIVGDFAGDQALSKVGDELRARKLAVSVFYTSNVEQYILDPPKWKRWVANIDALPSNEKSTFLRCYLDQGRKHPEQLDGHRTATVLTRFDHFKWRQRKRGYGSFYQVATDGVLTRDGGAPAK